MPRRRPAAKTEPLIPTSALVASATRYPGKAARIYQPRADWQAECYRHYAICGEARFAATFFGHAVSRATLLAGEMVGSQAVQTKVGPVAETLDALFAGKDGQKEMLEAAGTHLTIAGECYLVGRTMKIPNSGDEVDVWEVVSCIEMQVTGNSWQINYGDGRPVVPLSEDDVVIRIWTPNPARRMEADSPFRSLLPILSEIEWLTRHVFAQITSRLAGAGILFVPQGMTFPPPPEQTDDAGQAIDAPSNEADGLMRVLADAMLTPVQDPGSPAALIPIVVTAPDESIDQVKLMHFWSELDGESMNLRNEAIRRFALGMDLPPEQVLGMSSNGGTGGGRSNGVSHWGAWQIEEATIKLHVEPMLDVIVNALTISYLRPALPDNPSAVVIYDTSSLRLRPDRSKEAFELYDRGLLRAEVLLQENGFDPTDMPEAEEFKRWLLIKIASGSATPEQVQAACAALGVVLGATGAPSDSGGPTREARPAPSLEDHPTRPATPSAAALLPAAEALVFRALERAGNRLRNAGGRAPGVPAFETHIYCRANGNASRLLEDAWSCAPKVLEGYADPGVVVPVLDSYVQTLIAEQAPHTRERLASWLELARV